MTNRKGKKDGKWNRFKRPGSLSIMSVIEESGVGSKRPYDMDFDQQSTSKGKKAKIMQQQGENSFIIAVGLANLSLLI